jgi:hypothetical protein
MHGRWIAGRDIAKAALSISFSVSRLQLRSIFDGFSGDRYEVERRALFVFSNFGATLSTLMSRLFRRRYSRASPGISPLADVVP